MSMQSSTVVKTFSCALIWCACWAGGISINATYAEQGAPVRVYDQLLNPREHPDDARRHVQPPDWDTFGRQTRFVALRGFEVTDGKLVGYREEINKYVHTHKLAEVIWPAYPTLFASNLGDLADEIKRQELFLFNLWGFVPGSGPPGFWLQYEAPPGVFELLESKLGDRWLGMDVGEQDGRYVGGYANHMQPISTDRFKQYLNFHRHFERMCDQLGNRMSTLVSLNFGHYFLKEGLYTTIGAETAQGLPNGQVYYSFIRGAGKQYGVPWFGNASVWNRWGHYKSYGPPGADHSPTMGTSLSLLRRLLYSHILYNSVFVGMESGWLEGDQLTPIGKIQQAARSWVGEHGQPGTMLTPIALMVDFHSGWTFPRHLYTEHVYRVWGNQPYEAGDYLTDGVLDILYPGYQDSSYYHDETGFLTPTPYGDSADCLLSDAEGWLLDRYPVLVVAGGLAGGSEVRDKLTAYLESGGRLIITAGNLKNLPGGLAGVTVSGDARRFEAGTALAGQGKQLAEQQPFALMPLTIPAAAKVTLRCGEMPAIIDLPVGKGHLTVCASPFGIAELPAMPGPVVSQVDKPLAKPYPLLAHVRAMLEEQFRSQCLFEAGEGLSLITCRRAAGRYVLGICNNSWTPRPFKIVSHCGSIESVREWPIDQAAKTAIGYMATGLENLNPGESGPDSIAGGDVRVFEVEVREEAVVPIPHQPPPARARGRILPIRGLTSIQEQVLRRPTFSEHFDGLLIDWTYLRARDAEQVRREAGWIQRQGLRVLVDAGPGVNLYPDIRLVDNLKADYVASMAALDDVLAKMELLGARDLLLSLHRVPENNFTVQETEASFRQTLRQLCRNAEARRVTIHLRIGLGKPPYNVGSALGILRDVQAGNLRLAVSTAVLAAGGTKPADLAQVSDAEWGLWLAAGMEYDVGGQPWTVHGRLATSGQKPAIAALLATRPQLPIVLDAVYADSDEEYQDAKTLAAMAVNQPMSKP